MRDESGARGEEVGAGGGPWKAGLRSGGRDEGRSEADRAAQELAETSVRRSTVRLRRLTGATESTCWSSPCGTHRYLLLRRWRDLFTGSGSAGTEDGPLGFVGCNPSTADAAGDDPTLHRMIGFARRRGFSGVAVANLWSLRSTDPKRLRKGTGLTNEGTDPGLRRLATMCGGIVLAWGDASREAGNVRRAVRIAEVVGILRRARPGIELLELGRTKAGMPRHPLYSRAGVVPVRCDVTAWTEQTPEAGEPTEGRQEAAG